MSGLSREAVLSLIRLALREDQAGRDITSTAVLPATARARARLIARAPGILAGGQAAGWVFRAVDRRVRYRVRLHDGTATRPGQVVANLDGPARSIFAAERTALNLLGHLSGIATLTHAYARRVRGTRAKVYDTRKTLPGLRALEKHAVRAGGGRSHRGSLAEAVLIKTNHLKALGQGTGDRGQGIQNAIKRAKRRFPGKFVEVEVRTVRQFQSALTAQPDAILLDNMSLHDVRRAVHLSHVSRPLSQKRPLLEVSGGITLKNVRAYARAGVDRISIGRLTHSAPALDVSLEIV